MNSKVYKVVLSNIRHDLTNPINAILGYSELIIDIIGNEFSCLNDDVFSMLNSGKKILTYIKKTISDDNLENKSIIDILHNKTLQYNLRTPLTTIIGLAEFSLENKEYASSEDVADIHESLISIGLAGKNLLKLINNLMNYTEESIETLISRYKKESNVYNSINIDRNIKKINNNQSGTILIVDDEKSNLELLAKILKKTKNKVILANNGSKVLEILKKKYQTIDVILLDLVMPGIDGVELLSKIKENPKTFHIPTIMLSALDEIDTIINCINMGADDFLIKPINKTLLHARLNNSLEKKYFRDKEISYQNKIDLERKKSDNLLLNILPEKIAYRLKDGESLIADDIENATILFADIPGFTKLASKIDAKELVMLLNYIFSTFDELAEKHSLEKIKTIGDNYMLAGGLTSLNSTHALAVAKMAKDMINALPSINNTLSQTIKLRIGINTGPISAGVIGKKKFIYDVWGDTVNVASRMESFGASNRIHLSENTYNAIKDYFTFKKRSVMEIPGKGRMQTYFLNEYKLK